MSTFSFFNRDISWLYFNERVLDEAGKENVPLLERIKFLSIYSSNLDEFYRVRMPALMALQKITGEINKVSFTEASSIINRQLAKYGAILNDAIIPSLKENNINLVYDKDIPAHIEDILRNYFFTQVAGFLQPVLLSDDTDFFPENNQLYIAVIVKNDTGEEKLWLVNIPANNISRFLKVPQPEGNYILFLEDIICNNLQVLFPGAIIRGSYNIKITRDAELDLQDEFGDDMAEKIEIQLSKRDYGFATRFLYEPGIPLRHLQHIVNIFGLQKASVVEGGKHHNLKDLASLPVYDTSFSYPDWPPVKSNVQNSKTLFEAVELNDRIVHAPYQSYNTILRFFNEAAISASVKEIYTTLYRVANDSRIAHALISAAKNGKKVFVLVELKARFDEANNIRWSKKMKAAGVKIIYSDNALKVHAKIALVKRIHETAPYLGLLATGNLNETTAKFYTDHILLTAHQPMLTEMEMLFTFLKKGKKVTPEDVISFKHLLVAQFNLQAKFLELIDREIENTRKGLQASIKIKLNNLEERVLIEKLYEASNAGVNIQLIVRSICCLVPGIPGQSENITIKRIVDRYLEHGRVFIFHNNGNEEVYMGSADWMNRNIYRRIEVCFPVYDEAIKQQLLQIMDIQLKDNTQAVWIDEKLNNVAVSPDGNSIRSQQAIYELLVPDKKLLPEK